MPVQPVGVPGRAWRRRHPLRPRVGRRRQCAMGLLLALLTVGIGAYLYFTNQNRLRHMAADYLRGLVGGEVRIDSADLLIFEGLRLHGVRLLVTDASGAASELLRAGTVIINCNLRDLLAGHLSATQIIVVEPVVSLSEDTASGRWNYQLLGESRWPSTGAGGVAFTGVPEVLLRDAQVNYAQIKSGQMTPAGWMAADGHFIPLDPGSDRPHKYEFTLQSRGERALGPTMIGSVDMETGKVSAALSNVVFGTNIQAMLPSPVSQWCRAHSLRGAAGVKMEYVAGGYKVVADLNGVEMSIAPRPSGPAVLFHDVQGPLIFTNQRITAQHLKVTCENNVFDVDGYLEKKASDDGYTPDSPMRFTVSLPPGGELNIAPDIQSVAALPPVALGIYNHFRPWGRATGAATVHRETRGGPIHCDAQINVFDGGFTFADIPYPVHHVTGSLVVGHDDKLGFDVLRLVDIRGHGMDGSPNENAELTMNGWIGPFDATAGGEIDIQGSNAAYEPALVGALPPPARRAAAFLDANHEGFGSGMIARFSSHAHREEAGKKAGLPWMVQTDLSFTNGQLTCAKFPYRVDQVNGKIEIRPGYMNLVGIEGRHGPASVLLGGRIDFDHEGKAFSPHLRLAAEDVPIDAALLAALPDVPRRRMESLGVSGTLDAVGTIESPLPGYNLDLTLSDGAFTPRKIPEVSGVSGHLHLSPGRLDSIDLRAKRDDCDLVALGWLDWSGAAPAALLTLQANNLLLDDKLRDLLPSRAREVWNQISPAGTADLNLIYDTSQKAGPIALSIRPRQLSMSPRLAPQAEPVHLDDVQGELDLVPNRLATWDIKARDREGHIAMKGSWQLDDPSAAWEVHLTGRDLAADTELIQSLPPGLMQVLQALRLSGAIGFEFTKLAYHPASTQPSATRPSGPDVDFTVQVDFDKGSMFVGVPLDSVQGSANLTGSIRDGRLSQLSGDLSAPLLRIAGRDAGNLSAVVSKPADQEVLHISDIRAQVAGGDLAGAVAVQLAPDSVGRYALRLVLDGADVGQISGAVTGLPGTANAPLNGRISASLELSGSVGNPSDSRGRGDVRVVGDQMYQLPLVLGLFQITNLALPINSPFQRASARYDVQGSRVVLEQIQIAGRNMAIQGSGHLDFATKQVELTFTVDNTAWLSVPIVGPMWNKAQDEMMRIHVKGTLKSLKVSASSLDTFTTTVDEVFKGAPQR